MHTTSGLNSYYIWKGLMVNPLSYMFTQKKLTGQTDLCKEFRNSERVKSSPLDNTGFQLKQYSAE